MRRVGGCSREGARCMRAERVNRSGGFFFHFLLSFIFMHAASCFRHTGGSMEHACGEQPACR